MPQIKESDALSLSPHGALEFQCHLNVHTQVKPMFPVVDLEGRPPLVNQPLMLCSKGTPSRGNLNCLMDFVMRILRLRAVL